MEKKIGFIGLGNMGGALIKGLAKTKSKAYLFGYDNDTTKADMYNTILTCISSAQDLIETADIIIIAVKPNAVATLLSSLIVDSEKIIVSIAAGVTIASLTAATSAQQKIVRVMPNTPALVNEGMSALSSNEAVTKEELNYIQTIFSSVGKSLIVPENQMDAVTGMSGCGPAYFFTFIQAMADGGVKMGLSRADAVILAAQTALGAAKMVLETGEDPITLRNRVTSPGGSTIAAVHQLERSGISGIIMDAVEEATEVSSLLG